MKGRAVSQCESLWRVRGCAIPEDLEHVDCDIQ